MPLQLKQTFLPIVWILTGWCDGIKSSLPFRIFCTLLLLPRIFGHSYGPVLCVHETPSSLFVLHSSITATKWGEIISEVEFTFLYGNGLNAEMPLQKILDPKLQSSSAVEFYRGEKETVCSCLWQPKSIDWPNLIFVDSFSCHMLHSRCFPFPSFSSTLLNSILIS